jgi:hypothetical protein
MSTDSHSPSRPHVLRRNYLLDRGFQLKYIVRLALLGGSGVALVGGLAYRVHAAAMAHGPAPQALDSSGRTLLLLAVLGTLGSALLLGLFGLVLTHRVAGPVHVMSLYMAALAAGRYPRLRPLRKKDELRGFFERFSEAVDRIRGREAEEARLLAEALSALEPLATTPEARAALSHLAALQQRKRQAIEGASSGALKSVA